MYCDKIGYNKRDAQTALNNAIKQRKIYNHKNRKECRLYHCNECNMWHLTAMDEEEYGEKETLELSYKEEWKNLLIPIEMPKKKKKKRNRKKKTSILILETPKEEISFIDRIINFFKNLKFI